MNSASASFVTYPSSFPIIVAVAEASDGRLDYRLDQPLGLPPKPAALDVIERDGFAWARLWDDASRLNQSNTVPCDGILAGFGSSTINPRWELKGLRNPHRHSSEVRVRIVIEGMHFEARCQYRRECRLNLRQVLRRRVIAELLPMPSNAILQWTDWNNGNGTASRLANRSRGPH